MARQVEEPQRPSRTFRPYEEGSVISSAGSQTDFLPEHALDERSSASTLLGLDEIVHVALGEVERRDRLNDCRCFGQEIDEGFRLSSNECG